MDKSNNLLFKGAVAKSTQEDLIELATEIHKADSIINVNACSKLKEIAKQITRLKREAKIILVEAELYKQMHHVPCNFVKHPGHVYHLYEQEGDQIYFSMLSPDEWGESGPSQIYRGAYRLEDHSWTLLQTIKARNKEMAMVDELISNISSTLPNINLNINM